MNIRATSCLVTRQESCRKGWDSRQVAIAWFPPACSAAQGCAEATCHTSEQLPRLKPHLWRALPLSPGKWGGPLTS